MQALLEMRDISIRFGGLEALSDISFRVERGEIKALLGPNGAGKTTILNIINGVYRPSKGNVYFEGEKITGLRPDKIANLGIGRTFQNVQKFKELTVLENIMVPLGPQFNSSWFLTICPFKKTRNEETIIKGKAEEILSVLGLSPLSELFMENLPYGKQRLVEFARALVTNPKLVLLDEPSAGMNETECAELHTFIKQINNQGISVILIEHNMPFVMKLAQSVVVFDFGKKIAEGPPEQILKDEKVIEAYLGKSQ